MKVVDVAGRQAVLVNAAIKNAGSCRLMFKDKLSQELLVAAVFEKSWHLAVEEQQLPAWGDSIIFVGNLLEGDSGLVESLELEPGQGFLRSVLVPCPAGDEPLAYRATIRVAAHPRMVWHTKREQRWSTESVASTKEKNG